MAPLSDRVGRLGRVVSRLREHAAGEAARRAQRVGAIDRALATTRAAEDAARADAAAEGETGAALVLAWAWADELARRAMGLLDDRARAVMSAEGARDTLRERCRTEQQLARLAARIAERAQAYTARDGERRIDELVLRARGRKR
jgi:tetrahydromethanopterin S-methyltransferase subunit H